MALVNSATDSEKEITKLGLGGVLKYILRGAPFFWRSDRVPWKSVRVPRFPFVFSVLSGIFWGVVSFVVISARYGPETINKGELIEQLIGTCIVSIIIFLVLNCLIMAGFWIVLTSFNKSLIQDVEPNFCSGGVRRVAYFSTFFQPIFFLGIIVAFLLEACLYPIAKGRIFLLVTTIFGIIRLLAVFQSMRHETDGSALAGLLGLIPCLDVWLVFFTILISLI